MAVQEFTAPLEVDATRGRFNQFVVNGFQVMFPDELFQAIQFATPQIYDHNHPVQHGRKLTPKGLALYNRVNDLGGKGVTIIGETFERMTRFTQDMSRAQSFIMIQDIKPCEAANPAIMPELVEFIAQAERAKAAKKAEERADRLQAARDEAQFEVDKKAEMERVRKEAKTA